MATLALGWWPVLESISPSLCVLLGWDSHIYSSGVGPGVYKPKLKGHFLKFLPLPNACSFFPFSGPAPFHPPARKLGLELSHCAEHLYLVLISVAKWQAHKEGIKAMWVCLTLLEYSFSKQRGKLPTLRAWLWQAPATTTAAVPPTGHV